jgi:hypothetical protein
MYKWILIILLCFLYGCSLLRTYDEKIFRFNYAGDEYEIISKIKGDEVDYNLLQMYSKDGKLIIQGRDENSDGELDELMIGEINISEANHIYFIGIDQAMESGDLDVKNELRIFEITEPPYTYVIETVGYDDFASRRRMVYGYLKPVVVYNQLTIIDSEEQTEIILRDLDANRVLDSALDKSNVSKHQAIYKDLLGRGMKLDRVRLIEGMYIVIPVQ